jgi:2-oxoglutarate ferredoxin oxidoreductase subunit gamma
VIAITQLVSQDALKKAVTSSVPKGTEEKNLAGMEKGYQYGLDMMANGK